MYPGRPTHVRGKYIVKGLNPGGYANLVYNQAGDVIGWWFDDTTPNMGKWIQKAVPIARQQGLVLFCLIAPGDVGRRWGPRPPCVNLFEVYWKGYGLTWRQFFTMFIRPRKYRYAGYIMQRNYGWQDVGGDASCVPTQRQYKLMRAALSVFRPKYGLWDF